MRKLLLACLVAMWLVPASVSPPAASGALFSVQRDVVYRVVDGVTLKLDMNLPEGGGLHAGVILLHGGGFIGGEKEALGGVAQLLASRGFAVFTVNYRLAPMFPYPAAVEDAQAAVRWVRDHAAEFSVDPLRMAAVGSSAGGYLAAMVGTQGEGSLDTGSRVRVVVSLSGPMSLPQLLENGAQGAKTFVSDFLGCSGGTRCVSLAQQASPVSQVDGSDAAIFLANSLNESMPLQQAIVMDRALTQEHLPHEFVKVPGTMHGTGYLSFQVTVNGVQQSVVQAAVAFMNQWLNAPQGESSPGSSPSTSVPTSMPPLAGIPVGTGRPRSERTKRSAAIVALGLIIAFVIAGILLALTRRSRYRRARRGPESPTHPAGEDIEEKSTRQGS